MIVKETPRLILRELGNTDAAFMLELLNSAGWIRYIGDRQVHTTDQAMRYLQNGAMLSYRTNGFGLWLMQEKLTGNSVGICGLIKREGLAEIDLGFAILPQHERKGYTYEAADASIAIAKTLGLAKLVAITVTDNRASINLLHKLGFQFEKTMTLPSDNTVLNLFGLVL